MKSKITAVHALVQSKEDARHLLCEIPVLAGMGFNHLILELDYNYEYRSHPELRGGDPVAHATVREIVRTCRQSEMQIIPEFQSLGHQSWEHNTWALLTRYPHLDETPGRYSGNAGIYCRSWCALNREVYELVFDLYDELIEACEAEALHVGMDEVFLIGEDDCPRCRGKSKASLFAAAVNTIHDHLAERGVEMLMWGDRLLDEAGTGYGAWESSANGTSDAINMIPTDIIICDWHYAEMPGYPSIPLFLERGFRVLPTSYSNQEAAEALLEYSLSFDSDRMLGHLCTTWAPPRQGASAGNPVFKLITCRLNPQKSARGI